MTSRNTMRYATTAERLEPPPRFFLGGSQTVRSFAEADLGIHDHLLMLGIDPTCLAQSH